ncbi:unnamed protein product [Lactuca saligna]|uniref:Uncharacterized protein n=1 Tax=Lactuca saligna TaxID=75948 RepID=A0AA36E524_LACSI|nr:unnamed protein product [Lactuca saligna]
MEDYMFWYAHGELYPTQEIGQCSISEPAQDNDEGVGDNRRYEQMIIESMHQPEAPYYQQAPYCQQAKQNPNQSAQTFYKMLNQVSEPLWDGSKKASTLSTTTRLLNWKSECNVSDSSFDRLIPIIKDNLPIEKLLICKLTQHKARLQPDLSRLDPASDSQRPNPQSS